MVSKYFLVISFCCFLESCASAQSYEYDIQTDHSICVNTHLGYRNYDYAYRKEICKSIGKMNIGMIRDYVFINSANTFNTDPEKYFDKDRATIFNNVLYNLKRFAPNTQVLGVLHDLKWEIDKDIPLSVFYELVRKAVKMYDGNTKFVPTDYGKEMSYEIKYWEICNEFDMIIYGKPPFENVKKAFDFIKSTYIAIKETNPNALVVFPGIAHVNSKFIKDIFEYVDFDGKRVWNYYDVFNFHYYPPTAEKLIPIIDIVKLYKNKYGWKQPMWLTEVGISEFYLEEHDVAMSLPKIYLMAFACGIDKVFMFQQRRFDFDTSVDASYGLLRSSLDATYISLMSGGRPFSKGTGYNHILIKSKELKIPIMLQSNEFVAKEQLQKLKKRGLDIKGNKYIIDKIFLRHKKNNGEGSVKEIDYRTSVDGIHMSPSVFENCDIYDTILVLFKDFIKEIKWKKTDKTMSYFSMMELINEVPNGSSNFSLDVYDGIYVCRWMDDKKKLRMAVWSPKNKHVIFKNCKRLRYVNYMGENKIVPCDSLYLNGGIVYLEGNYNCIVP